jgi:hypothetical protein
MGGTHNKVEGGDRHDLEPEGTREDTRHKIYTGSGCWSSVGDSPRGPLKRRGNPHLKPATKPKHAEPDHAGA